MELETHAPLAVPSLLRPAVREGLWAVPLLLAVVFVAMVLAWAQHHGHREREASYKIMIADTRSLKAQLRARLEAETARLRALAAKLPTHSNAGEALLAAQPELSAGFERLWLRVTWLDDDSRVVAQRARPPELSTGRPAAAGETGSSLHLAAPIGERAGPTLTAARLIARYAPSDLLKSQSFWWLAAR